MKGKVLLMMMAWVLAGCGADRYNEQIQLGERLFTAGTETAPACVLCHSLDNVILIGPSLQHVGTTASERVKGQSAAEYLRESIVRPSAYKVPGYETGVMFATYSTGLTAEQIEALVVFMQAQK